MHSVAPKAPKLRSRRTLLQAGALQSAIFNSANFSSIATDARGVIQIFNVGEMCIRDSARAGLHFRSALRPLRQFDFELHARQRRLDFMGYRIGHVLMRRDQPINSRGHLAEGFRKTGELLFIGVLMNPS